LLCHIAVTVESRILGNIVMPILKETSISVPARASVAPIGPGATSVLVKIFLVALAMRWGYALILYLSMGDAGLMSTDSSNYLEHSQAFVRDIFQGSVRGWHWLGLDPFMMPLMTWMVALHVVVFGTLAPLAYVLSQGLLDSITCLLVYGIASEFSRSCAGAAAGFAAVNPTQIVISGFVLTDTQFLFFVAVVLFAAARWMRNPSWRWALLMGGGLAGAAMFRILIVAWVPALLIFLLVVRWFKRLSFLHFFQLTAAAAIFGVAIGTLMLRNFHEYDTLALSPQNGMHLNWWVVPLVKEAQDGTPWARSMEEMLKRTRDRFGPQSVNPFVESQRYAQVAMDELKVIGMSAIAKAWIFGAAVNLGSPAIILSPPVATLPRTGFYGTTGATLTEKVWNFLFRSTNPTYALILIAGALGLACVRIIQLAGMFAILRRESRNIALVLLLAGWCGFILLVNGPVASPKYRLPMEPALDILAGAGIAAIYRRRTSARS
jgi:4-amino-4-deoxy-L-arabinose transferase-like glycosyltransferase